MLILSVTEYIYWYVLKLDGEFTESFLFIVAINNINRNLLHFPYQWYIRWDRNINITMTINVIFILWIEETIFQEKVYLLDRQNHLKRRLTCSIWRFIDNIIEFILVILIVNLQVHPLLTLSSFSIWFDVKF